MILNACFTVDANTKAAEDDVKQFGNIHFLVVASKWAEQFASDASCYKFGWFTANRTTTEGNGSFSYKDGNISIKITLLDNKTIHFTCECWKEEAALWVMEKILTHSDRWYMYGSPMGSLSIQQQVKQGVLKIQREQTSPEVLKFLEVQLNVPA